MARSRELPFGRYYGGVDTTPLVRDAGRRLCGPHRRHGLHRHSCGPRWSPRPAGSRTTATADGDGLRRLRRAARERPGQPGLEGQPGLRLPRRRPHSARARSRWSRCRAMSSPPTGRWPRSPRRRGERTRGASAGRPRPSSCAPRSSGVLDGGSGLLRHRARWRRRALPRARSNAGHLLFTGLPSPERRARSLTSSLGAFSSGWGMRTLADGEAALQSDVLSQRLDLAARYGDLHAPAWRATASATAWSRLMSGTFEAAVAFRHAAAGAVLRLHARAGRGAGRLSGRLPAAGMVGRLGVHADAGLPRPGDRWLAPANPCRPGQAADRHRPLTIRRLGVGAAAVDLSSSASATVSLLSRDRHEGLVPLIVRS